LFSQASFKNGRLVIIGNGFDYSDFSNSNLQNGNEYTMNQNQKILNLTTNLNEDMVIQVSISTDAGNIMDGDSEIERSSVKLSTSLGMDNLINISLMSDFDQIVNLEIRDLYGNQIKENSILNLLEIEKFQLVLGREAFANKGSYFVVIVKLKNGQLVTSNLLIP